MVVFRQWNCPLIDYDNHLQGVFEELYCNELQINTDLIQQYSEYDSNYNKDYRHIINDDMASISFKINYDGTEGTGATTVSTASRF